MINFYDYYTIKQLKEAFVNFFTDRLLAYKDHKKIIKKNLHPYGFRNL